MEIPKDVRKWADDGYRKISEKEQKKREAEKSRKKAEEERRKRCRDEGIADARFVFQWAKAFAASTTGKKIIKFGAQTFLNGVMFFDEHIEGQPFRGLGVSRDSVWWIRSGCGAYPEPVRNPGQLAEEVETAVLRAAVSNIKSGKVWETIKNRWELKEIF